MKKTKNGILLITFLVLVTLLIGCTSRNIFGSVNNPKLPSFQKPANLNYCEKDSDCTTTLHAENSCCLLCEGSISTEGAKYLEEWYDINCQKPEYSKECLVIECCELSDVKCMNHTCIAISECT